MADGQTSGFADLNNTNKGGVTNLSLIYQVLLSTFPRINGTFSLSAATTTIVTQPAISASSIVAFFPTNGTAALIERTNGLFHNQSANVAGASFTMSTQAGSATAGGTFSYYVINPS